MAQTDAQAKPRRGLFGTRNLVAFGAAAGCLIAGYLVLSSGQASVAAVLLVVGYCVLFPLAIAL